MATKKGQLYSLQRECLGAPPQSPARIWGQIAGTQGCIGTKWVPWWEKTSSQSLLKQRCMALFITSANVPGSILNSTLASLCSSGGSWEAYSHFQMMLPQRMQTQIHIKLRQSMESVTLLGHTLMHTLLHALHHCICSKATKSDFQIICYLGLSAPLLATMSMAN